jgi:ubiquinone biosynthesis protein UbiJ
MRVPSNSAAELVAKLESEATLLEHKIIDAKRSYAEYIANAQQELQKNQETRETLEEVATWNEIEDLLADS